MRMPVRLFVKVLLVMEMSFSVASSTSIPRAEPPSKSRMTTFETTSLSRGVNDVYRMALALVTAAPPISCMTRSEIVTLSACTWKPNVPEAITLMSVASRLTPSMMTSLLTTIVPSAYVPSQA